MDEATANLNDELKLQVLAGVLSLGVTVIAASHDELVLARADWRIRLETPKQP